ncbi:hypothetical protein DID88_008965 [Monilinia fructigena]|uniref:ACT domain-containing protein n=1 Tax=Monilinia fructigena TaxID=38457 RepID=A0A395J7M5_9HELO|nr:hypothetical protein DID88_008965 [Monilinia fructigena]
MAKEDEYILTLSCPDRPGIVHAVTGFLTQHNLNIVDSQQFGDPTSLRFFMRVHFAPPTSSSAESEAKKFTVEELNAAFENMPRTWVWISNSNLWLKNLGFSSWFRKSVTVLMICCFVKVSPNWVSSQHLQDPLPPSPRNGSHQSRTGRKDLDLVKEHNIDLIVLARYMQVLSPTLCTAMSGKIINIHHSFLPSFKGAKPYHQADLDEGPIIEQNVVRVGHGLSPKELTVEGSNVESNVLATAVKWVTERRVLLNGHKTVVFN